MFIKFKANNKMVFVRNLEKISYIGAFHKKSCETLLVNNTYILMRRDLIIFTCIQCRKHTKERFLGNFKFLDSCLCFRCQAKKTNLQRYGSENVFSSIEIRQKIVKIYEEKFNVDNPSKNVFVIEKIRKAQILKAGQTGYGLKTLWLKKYGCNNPMQNLQIKTQSIQTRMQRHCTGGFNGKSKWFYIDGQIIQGTFEKSVVEWLKSLSVEWIAHRNIPTIKYIISGSLKYYRPDIYLPEFSIFLDPHASYFWSETFDQKVKLVRTLNSKVFFFDEKEFEALKKISKFEEFFNFDFRQDKI